MYFIQGVRDQEMILIPLLVVLSALVIPIRSLDCSDSELNVIVRQLQPFETNGTGIFTDAVQSALEYCCYPARPNLSLAIVRSEADLVANRLIWDSTFLYYPIAYKSQLHFIPLIRSPGSVLIVKSSPTIFCLAKLISIGWPTVVFMLTCLLFVGTLFWCTETPTVSRRFHNLIETFVDGLLTALLVPFQVTNGYRRTLKTKCLTVVWAPLFAAFLFLSQAILLCFMLTKTLGNESDLKIGVLADTPESQLRLSPHPNKEFANISHLYAGFEMDLVEAILVERYLSDHFGLSSGHIAKLISNPIQYGLVINRKLNESLADCLGFYLEINQVSLEKQLKTHQRNISVISKSQYFHQDSFIPWLTPYGLLTLGSAISAASLLLAVIKCFCQRRVSRKTVDPIQSLYNQLLISEPGKGQRIWQSNLGRYDQVLLDSDLSQTRTKEHRKEVETNAEIYQLPADNRFRSRDHSVLDCEQKSNCSSTKDLLALSLLSLADNNKPTEHPANSDNLVFFRSLKPNSNGYMMLHL